MIIHKISIFFLLDTLHGQHVNPTVKAIVKKCQPQIFDVQKSSLRANEPTQDWDRTWDKDVRPTLGDAGFFWGTKNPGKV